MKVIRKDPKEFKIKLSTPKIKRVDDIDSVQRKRMILVFFLNLILLCIPLMAALSALVYFLAGNRFINEIPRLIFFIFSGIAIAFSSIRLIFGKNAISKSILISTAVWGVVSIGILLVDRFLMI